ncbi:MAG: hypothetical protein AAB551_00435 [Patescibacteria group bacterium]
MNKKVILGLVAVVVLAAGIFLGQGDLFKGSYFRTVPNKAPNKPTIISPMANSTVGTSALKVEWTDGGDPDNGPQAMRNYRWMLWDYPAGNVIWQRDWHDNTSGITDGGKCNVTIGADQNDWICPYTFIKEGKLEAGKTYKFSVEAGDGKVGSGYSATVFTVATSQSAAYEVDPIQLAGYSVYEYGKNRLEWVDQNMIFNPAYKAEKDRKYYIYRSETPGVSTSGTPIGTALSSEVKYVDVLADKTKKYYYAIANKGIIPGTTATSNEVFVAPKVKEYVPIQLSYNVANSVDGTVQLLWTDPAGPQDGEKYEIYRSTGSPVEIKPENIAGMHIYDSASLKAGTSFNGQNNFPPGPKGTTYYYVVKINAPGAWGSKSNELKVVLK